MIGRIQGASMRDAIELIEKKIRTAMPFAVYLCVYMICFELIEGMGRRNYTVIEADIDRMIPFCEIFVVPYLLWFVYSFLLIVYILFVDEESYHKICAWYVIGMSLFIAVSAVFPNIQFLRPMVMPRENIFTELVRLVYASDTPTNVTPSIHVYNSLGMMTVIAHSDTGIFRKKWVRVLMEGFGVLIILSTMLIKQHSALDVVAAMALGAAVTRVLYPVGARVPGRLQLGAAVRR